MTMFRTTEQIFKGGLHFDQNWLELPPWMLERPEPTPWFGQKDMTIEDVDFWEVLFESGGGNGLYAAWQPYGEIYLIRHNDIHLECFSGKNANWLAEQYCIKNNLYYPKTEGMINVPV